MPARMLINFITDLHLKKSIKIKSISSEKELVDAFNDKVGGGIEWIDNSCRNEAKIINAINNQKIDILLSLQHKWIISNKVIDAVSGCAFNTHFGKLPEYRGHHIHIHPILNNEKSITTTLHFMDSKVDYGDIILEKETDIGCDDTSWSLWHKAVDDAVELNKTIIMWLIEGKKIPIKKVTGNGKFYKVNSLVGVKEIVSLKDFNEVDRKSRAFYYPPHEPAFFLLNDKKYYVIPKPFYHKTVV